MPVPSLSRRLRAGVVAACQSLCLVIDAQCGALTVLVIGVTGDVAESVTVRLTAGAKWGVLQ